MADDMADAKPDERERRDGCGAEGPMNRLDALTSLLRLLHAEADRGIRSRLLASLALALAGSLLAGLAPLALKALIDGLPSVAGQLAPASAMWAPDRHRMLHAVVLHGGLYLLALGLGRVLADLRPWLAGEADHRLHTRLACRYHAGLLALPMSFHTASATGAMAHGLSQATAGCQLLIHGLLQAAPIAMELVTVLAVLAHLGQPVLAGLFGLSAACYATVHALGIRQVRRRSQAVSQAASRLQAHLAEDLMALETVQAFQAQTVLQRRFASAAHSLELQWSALHRQRLHMGLFTAAVFTASIGLALAVAVHAVATGSLSLGGFVLTTVCMLQMVRPLELLGAALRDAAQAGEFARPLLEVLQASDQAAVQQLADRTRETVGTGQDGAALSREPAAATARSCMGPPAIRFEAVRLSFPGHGAVLHNLDLDIEAGATVAIVGTSGAGKSSIARLLLRLVEPEQGRILWGGRPADQLPTAMLRRQIGFVPQDITLYNDSIAANIAFGLEACTRSEIEEVAELANLHHLAGTLPAGLDTCVGERGLRLSGGERQRIAIARALLRRPSVYVFDEVTSMLDASTEAALLHDLQRICRGSTTIFITHRLTAASQADKVVVLDRGRVVQCGSHAHLLETQGHYRRLWLDQLGANATR